MGGVDMGRVGWRDPPEDTEILRNIGKPPKKGTFNKPLQQRPTLGKQDCIYLLWKQI